MTVPGEEAPANFVPAAAVKRGGQVLLDMTGRKGQLGCSAGGGSKSGFSSAWPPRRLNWSSVGGGGTSGVEVKFGDTGGTNGRRRQPPGP